MKSDIYETLKYFWSSEVYIPTALIQVYPWILMGKNKSIFKEINVLITNGVSLLIYILFVELMSQCTVYLI